MCFLSEWKALPPILGAQSSMSESPRAWLSPTSTFFFPDTNDNINKCCYISWRMPCKYVIYYYLSNWWSVSQAHHPVCFTPLIRFNGMETVERSTNLQSTSQVLRTQGEAVEGQSGGFLAGAGVFQVEAVLSKWSGTVGKEGEGWKEAARSGVGWTWESKWMESVLHCPIGNRQVLRESTNNAFERIQYLQLHIHTQGSKWLLF